MSSRDFGNAIEPRAKRFRMRMFFTLAFIPLLAGISCSRQSSGDAKPPAPAIAVQVAHAATLDVPVEITAIGNVQAYSVVSVRPQITGPIMQVHFEEGQEVKAGDLLFTLDPRSLEAALNQAVANLKRDEAQMINARMQFERTSNLFESKIASQQDFDTANATYLAAQSTVVADHAAITNAQVSLGYTSIRAPISGRTGNALAKQGNVVKAPDDALVTITQIRPIYVTFAVPEQYLGAIRQRARQTSLSVKVFAPSDTNDIAFGELTFIDNSVDTNTGSIFLKGTFPNTNDVLWPGQFVQTSLTLNTLKQATVIPSQAVQIGQNGEYVFVVKPDSTVEVRTNLSVGIAYQGRTVITRGLEPGESVVTDGQLRLTPGAKVTVTVAETEGSSTNTVGALP